MTVNAVEFRKNLSEYLLQLSEEDIYIARHGRIVGVLTDPDRAKKSRSRESVEQIKKKIDEYTFLTRDYFEKVIRIMEEIKAAVD